MPGTDGLSQREVLERLCVELRRLSPDAFDPDFEDWHARVQAAMSYALGPRHRLTLALRDVSFTPDFDQGRARAFALLRSAGSLAGTQPLTDSAARTPPPSEPKRETVFRRFVRKRSSAQPWPADLPAAVEPATMAESAAAREPAASPEPIAAADSVAAPGPTASFDVAASGIAAAFDGVAALDDTAAFDGVAALDDTATLDQVTSLDPGGPVAVAEPTESEWPDWMDSPEPAQTGWFDLDTGTPEAGSTLEPAAIAATPEPPPELVCEPAPEPAPELSPEFAFDAAVEEPSGSALTVELIPDPAPEPGSGPTVEPAPLAGESKRATLFKKLRRKREQSVMEPTLPDEAMDAVTVDAFTVDSVVAPDTIGDDLTEVESILDVASVSPTTGDIAEAAEVVAPEPPDTPAAPAETTSFAEATGSALDASAEPATPESLPEPAAIAAAAAVPPPGAAASAPAAGLASASSPGPAPVVAPAPPRGEPIARGPDVYESAQDRPYGFEDPWAAETADQDFEEPVRAGRARPAWGDRKAARGARSSGRRLTIAALLVVLLGIVVGVPAWLYWFDGWATVFAIGSTEVPSTTTSRPSTLGPSADAHIVDVTGDPRSASITEVVRAGIVRLQPNAAGEVSFLPSKAVGRGEFLVWLDRVHRIPAAKGEVPDTFYYDLDSTLRETAIAAYERRIVLEWPAAGTKVAFRPADPIVARDAEAWAARMIIGVVPAAVLQTALGITEADAVDLRKRISSLTAQELTLVVEGFELVPESGWAKKESVTRSEVAELLMKLKAIFAGPQSPE